MTEEESGKIEERPLSYYSQTMEGVAEIKRLALCLVIVFGAILLADCNRISFESVRWTAFCHLLLATIPLFVLLLGVLAGSGRLRMAAIGLAAVYAINPIIWLGLIFEFGPFLTDNDPSHVLVSSQQVGSVRLCKYYVSMGALDGGSSWLVEERTIFPGLKISKILKIEDLSGR